MDHGTHRWCRSVHSKDKRDIYYRKAKEQGYRARSAFKLLQINEEMHILEGVQRVVDLCAAPGSWSQVLSNILTDQYNKLKSNSPDKEIDPPSIIAIDLQDITPIPYVTILKGDITRISTAEKIISLFSGSLADLVTSDGAPDVTGLHDIDEYMQSQLVLSAFCIATHVLKQGGAFISKIFRGKDVSLLLSQLNFFSYHFFLKMFLLQNQRAVGTLPLRALLCVDYSPPPGYIPTMISPKLSYDEWNQLTGINRILVPFISCGDLSGFDADQNYPLDEKYEPIPPVTPSNEF